MKIEIILYMPAKMPPFYKKAIAEYDKRLGRYGKVSLRTIKKEKDWLKCIEEADSGFYLVAGQSISSEEFSQKISHWESERLKDVTFFVNDSYGNIAPDNKSLQVFSVSDFSINGPMTVMILFEQIYRAYRIINNHPYHK